MEVELRPTKMDDFIGEVSCTEVLGIKPGEQALTHCLPLSVYGGVCVCVRGAVCCGGHLFSPVCVSPVLGVRTALTVLLPTLPS